MTGFNQQKSGAAGSVILRTAAAFALAAGLAGTAALQAAPQAGASRQMTPEQAKQVEDFKKLRADYMQTQQRLNQIQTDTMKAHPELQKQKEAFQDLMEEEMKKNGASPKKDIAEIEALQGKLQSGKTPESERQALTGQLQGKVQSFQQAQQKAMQNEKVKKAQEDLMNNILQAMKKQDPETQKLMDKMTQQRQDMVQMLQAAGAGQGHK